MAFKSDGKEHVVLLHGLARSANSMGKLERRLVSEGYRVHNLDYPSTKHSIEELASQIAATVANKTKEADRVHFVTHSMGGILVRQIQKTNPVYNIGRVVMLSPPNSGSEVVDTLGDLRPFRWLNGPAGKQLGTDGLPSQLGTVEFELGIITGDRSINLILSQMIPGKDDGKVSIESAKVVGMKEFRVVHASHPMIMKKRNVIEMVTHFLGFGRFEGL